ncbi:MAG: nicotianamine synthase family protein [Anderseniella sp.]
MSHRNLTRVETLDVSAQDKSLQAQDARSKIVDLLAEIIAFAATVSGDDPYQAVGSVLAPLEGCFLELESYAVETDQALVRAILSDPEILEMLPQAYAVRALYEHELEWRCASETIASPKASDLIAKQVADKFEALPSAFYEVLAGCRRVLFAGSGPFPTTAMALHRKFNRPVVCIDRDARANELAHAYVAKSETPYELEFVDSELADVSNFDEFDCVVCAFLIGVGTSAQPLDTKSMFIRDVVRRMPPNLPLVLRSPQGLGRLVYPPLSSSSFVGLRFAEYPDSSLPSLHPLPYDKSFTIIEKI